MNGIQGRKAATLTDLQRYESSQPNKLDTIFSPLYDYQSYPAAGQIAFTFFSVPQGQGATSAFGGAGPKTILDTNMQTAGQLPRGNRFLAVGIEVEFFPYNLPGFLGAGTNIVNGRNWNDVYTVLRNGALTLNVQNRIFAQDAPLSKFPTQTRLAGAAAISGGAAIATEYSEIEYASGAGAAYGIVPLMLQENQAFNVTVNFPALIPLPSTTNAARIGVRLVGQMIRNAQ